MLVVGPFLWMLLGSFRPDRELKQVPPAWLPQNPTLDNYRTLFTELDFPTFFFNSTVVAVAITVGNLVFCSMLGYALAKLHFPGKRVDLQPGARHPHGARRGDASCRCSCWSATWGWSTRFPGLIFPFLAGPFGVFLMRQFFQSLPDELIHAARVDGAGEFRIFRSIICRCASRRSRRWGSSPSSRPGTTSCGRSWSRSPRRSYTLPVALAIYAIGENNGDYGLLMAGSVAIIVPVLVVFLALQRHFVRGIAMTGIK